jgi:hypothetical protein
MAMLGQWLVLLHIVSAFAMVSGLIGRELTRVYALRQVNVEMFAQFIGLTGWFESWLVIPGSTAMRVFGLVAAWVVGWPIFGILQASPTNWLFVSLLLYLSLIPVIAFVFVPSGKVFEQRLAEAQAQGIITPELRAAMNAPAVRAGHIYEALAVLCVIYLMVMKPF